MIDMQRMPWGLWMIRCLQVLIDLTLNFGSTFYQPSGPMCFLTWTLYAEVEH